MAVEHRIEMGITRPEFLRLLPAAVDAGEWHGDEMRGRWNGVAWRISAVEMPERRIASLAIPVLEVRLRFDTPDAWTVAPFLDRFHRAYQRAGG